jgi:hypothetical protein
MAWGDGVSLRFIASSLARGTGSAVKTAGTKLPKFSSILDEPSLKRDDQFLKELYEIPSLSQNLC